MSPESSLRVKLDENLGQRGFAILSEAGYEIDTVAAEDLYSASDATLIEVCRAEKRVLISLDKDFANTLRFHPKRYAGIVVLRLPEPIQLKHIDQALRQVIALASVRPVLGRLWIVETNRIREFSEEEEQDTS